MSFENIKLEKGMYNVRGGITAALESIDPSENYKGTELEGLDAYQRQLKRFDIKVAGKNSDVIEKFFSTTDSAALFPEYISRAVKTGIVEDDVINDIVATTTHINSMDYRSIISTTSNDDKELLEVEEGEAIPETSIETSDKLVTLKKRGRMLVASYEALKFQRLDLFTIALKQIGSDIARQQFKDATLELYTDTTANDTEGDVLTYSDLFTLWNDLAPYKLNTIIATSAALKAIALLPEFQNAANGFNFASTGNLDKPLGAKLFRTTNITGTSLIAFDKNYALERVIASDVSVDYDRIIDRQLERAAISSIVGFSKIFNASIRRLVV
ncbi:MAG: phage major capsid protein [Clostridia bacterium]|nr:phage major capsid protein [Clostridia bacterium]